MVLSKLDKNDNAEIKIINGQDDFINRLSSFGIMENSLIKVIEFSFNKKTMEIECEGTAIALRIKEADLIEVTKI